MRLDRRAACAAEGNEDLSESALVHHVSCRQARSQLAPKIGPGRR